MTRKVAIVALAFAGCMFRQAPNSDPGIPPPPRPEAVANPEVGAYLAGLEYNPRKVLAEEAGDSVLPPEQLPDQTTDDGTAVVVVRQVKHHLGGTLDDLLILNPTHGVVWPGAIVKADEDLVRGTPTLVQLPRAPVYLSVDLPGIGGNGVFVVDDPSQATVQAAVDRALDYWNDHQYQEGYVSKSRSKYASTIVYSSEQLAAALGVSYWSLKGSLAAQFQGTTTRERKVAMALFKQVFYTVSFDAPPRPAAVFHPSVTLDDARFQLTKDAPPAYVSSVDYGRILMLRIESGAETQHAEFDAAVRYLGAHGKVSADVQRTLEKSQVTLITIGGNAEVNTSAVSASGIRALDKVIQGKNALYSKNNPGQPIAYTIRFLKDGRIAKIGFSTDYTELVAERTPHGRICFENRALYVAKFYANWDEGGQRRTWESGERPAPWRHVILLKGSVRDININGQGLGISARWSDLFRTNLGAAPNKCYVATGSAFKLGFREEQL